MAGPSSSSSDTSTFRLDELESSLRTQSRAAARGRYELFVEAAARAINDADPMSLLEFDAPPDEYSPEVGTVVPRVVRASSPDEVRAILHEELERWFGEGSVGRPEGFQAPADSIWKAVLAFRQVD